MLFAAVSVAINITVALTLFPSMGAPGIATAAAISGWANAALLFGTLAWRGHWGSDRLAASFAPDALFVVQAPALLMMVLGAMVIYFAAAFATGGADVGMLRRNVKRGERPLPPLE
jgi:putative peptidoglycan lipid II flippase